MVIFLCMIITLEKKKDGVLASGTGSGTTKGYVKEMSELQHPSGLK